VWSARLELSFERVGARTVIARRRHSGPLLVQRPFYEADGGCQVYLIHPPGGVVGGDQLALTLELGAGSRTLVTTPAATKIYASPAARSQLSQRCQLADSAFLELLPQETILYAGARAHAATVVLLGSGSQFVGWEVLCLGRDAAGFSTGEFVQQWHVERQGRLLWAERSLLEGGMPALRASWGLAGRSVVGTMLGTGAQNVSLEALRPETLCPGSPCSETPLGPGDDWLSVTRLGEVLVCRYLGYSAETAKRFFSAAWAVLRPSLSGRTAVHPRIWAT
jgi:urease accessory protein